MKDWVSRRRRGRQIQCKMKMVSAVCWCPGAAVQGIHNRALSKKLCHILQAAGKLKDK